MSASVATTLDHHVGEPPAWSRWREAKAVIAYPPHLRRTVCIALVVGTVLFAINQLDIVLQGDVPSSVWLKCALTYLVPFCTSNLGMLLARPTPSPSPSSLPGADGRRCGLSVRNGEEGRGSPTTSASVSLDPNVLVKPYVAVERVKTSQRL